MNGNTLNVDIQYSRHKLNAILQLLLHIQQQASRQEQAKASKWKEEKKEIEIKQFQLIKRTFNKL